MAGGAAKDILSIRPILRTISKELGLMKLREGISYFERVKLLCAVSLLEPLSREEIEQFGRGISSLSFDPNQHIYTPPYEGEMLLLLRGRVRIYKVAGGQQITLRIVRAGEMFGEVAFGARKSQGAYAQALELSEVAFMSRDTFVHLLYKEPLVGLKAVELFSEHLSFYEDRIVSLSVKRVLARLSNLLLELIESEGVVIGKGRYRIITRYTHQQLGSMIGAKRVAVTKGLGKLQASGAVDLIGRCIYVKDMDALTRFAKLD
jgi:CRP/FNR family cyclic AMP-dependent transcriptional regulator